jgi:ATP:dephospho-CoA triphosphoribosyl transferase
MILSNCSPAGAARRCRGSAYVRGYARQLLREGGALVPDGVKKVAAFDDALITRHLSPGGTADLLGLTWFLARFPSRTPIFPGSCFRPDQARRSPLRSIGLSIPQPPPAS